MYWPPSRTSANAASTSARTEANWPLTSTRGIFCTASHSSDPEKVRRQRENACNDRIFDVSEIVMRVGVRGAQRPPRAGQPEAKNGAADERQAEEAEERDTDDPGRNRDERP